jgi:hypothetical protein
VRSENGATVVEVAGDDVHDTVTWPDGDHPLEVGPMRCRACAGWARRDADGHTAVVAAGVGAGPVWMSWNDRDGIAAGREAQR